MRFAIAALLALLGMSVAQAQNLHVLTVGVDICEEKKCFECNAYTGDAQLVFKVLKDQSPAPVIGKCLTGKKATREAVLKELNAIKKRARPGDGVFVFFSIHGEVDERDGFLIHTMRKDLNDKKWRQKVLWGTEIADVLNTLPCPSLLALDACHAGAMADIPLKNTVLMCASESDGIASGAPTGHFGGALIDGLKGEADWTEDYEVNVKELGSYIRWQTPKRSPRWQVPEIYYPKRLGDWVLTRQPKPIPLAKD